MLGPRPLMLSLNYYYFSSLNLQCISNYLQSICRCRIWPYLITYPWSQAPASFTRNVAISLLNVSLLLLLYSLTEFTMAARVILYKAGSAYVTPLFKTLNTSTIHSQRQLESPKSLWSPLHLFLSLHPSSPPSEYTGFRCVVASGFFTCSFCCWVFFSYV